MVYYNAIIASWQSLTAAYKIFKSQLDTSTTLPISKPFSPEPVTKKPVPQQSPFTYWLFNTVLRFIMSNYSELSYSLPMIFSPLLNMLAAVPIPVCCVTTSLALLLSQVKPAGPSETLSAMKQSSYWTGRRGGEPFWHIPTVWFHMNFALWFWTCSFFFLLCLVDFFPGRCCSRTG